MYERAIIIIPKNSMFRAELSIIINITIAIIYYYKLPCMRDMCVCVRPYKISQIIELYFLNRDPF